MSHYFPNAFSHASSSLAITRLVLVLVLLAGCSTEQFYRPSTVITTTPAERGLKFEDVQFSTRDDKLLHGWWLPSMHDVNRGVIVFLHGNSGNVSQQLMHVSWLPRYGYDVFMFDYRGFGQSEGTPELPGLTHDVAAAFDWLEQRLSVGSCPVFLLGQSLGGALALHAAGSEPGIRDRLSGVISDAGFASWRRIAREKIRMERSTFVTWIAGFLITDRYSAVDVVGNISPVPLLLIHSADDNIVPYQHGVDLMDAANEPKSFMETSGLHVRTFKNAAYREKFLAFLRENSAGHQCAS